MSGCVRDDKVVWKVLTVTVAMSEPDRRNNNQFLLLYKYSNLDLYVLQYLTPYLLILNSNSCPRYVRGLSAFAMDGWLGT